MKKPPVRGGLSDSSVTTLDPAEQQRRALERLEVKLAQAGHPSPEAEARRLLSLNLNPVLASDNRPRWTRSETHCRDCGRQISKRWPNPNSHGGRETDSSRCSAPQAMTRGARC
jgi:hypothetical protein